MLKNDGTIAALPNAFSCAFLVNHASASSLVELLSCDLVGGFCCGLIAGGDMPVFEQGRLVGVVNRGRLTRRSFEACLGTAE